MVFMKFQSPLCGTQKNEVAHNVSFIKTVLLTVQFSLRDNAVGVRGNGSFWRKKIHE